MLYGERRIGKTSILKQLERRLNKPYFVFYSDLEKTPYHVIQKFCRYTLSRLHEERSKRTRIKLEDVMEAFQKDILREYADEYDKVWESFDENTRATLLEVVKNRVTDHRNAAKLLQQTLRAMPYVQNNRLVYFENSHIQVFSLFKEWVMKNAI
ncbi:ATP-binding protein [candidate division KSB1 bacterium]|nr:ATP-binding protein [candidate division KSB1 bacterium]